MMTRKIDSRGTIVVCHNSNIRISQYWDVCLLQVDIFLKEVRQKQAWLGSPSGFSWLELAFMPFWQIVKGGCRILNV